MENSRNKQVKRFKLHTVLSGEIKSHAVPLCPAWKVNHPFVQCAHAAHPTRLPVTERASQVSDQVWRHGAVVTRSSFLFGLAPEHKSHAGGNSDRLESKVLPLREKAKVLDLK